jgi:hypothetical protein
MSRDGNLMTALSRKQGSPALERRYRALESANFHWLGKLQTSILRFDHRDANCAFRKGRPEVEWRLASSDRLNQFRIR